MSTMAKLLVGRVAPRGRLAASILIASFLLSLLSAASALSVAPQFGVRGRSIAIPAGLSATTAVQRPRRASSTSLFPAPARTLTKLEAAPASHDGRLQLFIRSPRKAAFAALSKVSHRVIKLRRTLLRAMAILSFCLFSMRSAPAHAAWGKTTSNVVVVDAPVESSSPTAAGKLTKVVVTVGAVVAGAATAKKVRNFGDEDNESSSDDTANSIEIREDEQLDNVVPKDKPSPLPLSKEWIEQELKEAEAEKKNPKPNGTKKPPISTPGIQKDPILVKNLDSKIEMLRAREQLAKEVAEAKRKDEMEKAAEARKLEQSEIDAKIAAAEQQQLAEEKRLEVIRKDKKREEKKKREAQLSELENGKKEQVRLEKREMKQQQKEQEQSEEIAAAAKAAAAAAAASEAAAKAEAAAAVAEAAAAAAEKMEAQQANAGSNIVSDKVVETVAETVADKVSVDQARQQPKSIEEEKQLQEKYGNMDPEERAFNILVDLGMVDLHSDPGSLDLNDEEDDGNVFM